jgi:mRNA interferase RelE/StbE
MYEIIIQRQAKKKLLALSMQIRTKIAGQIQMLGFDPDDPRLDIKKMKGAPGFRLRIGQWRVIFERDDQVKIISIEKIGARGDIYK